MSNKCFFCRVRYGSDNVGNGGANEFAHGEGEQGGSAEEFLHNTFNGPAVDKNGNADCGAGQTGYVQASNPLRDKSVKGDPYQGVVTEHYPIAGGRLGPTYAHLDQIRVGAPDELGSGG